MLFCSLYDKERIVPYISKNRDDYLNNKMNPLEEFVFSINFIAVRSSYNKELLDIDTVINKLGVLVSDYANNNSIKHGLLDSVVEIQRDNFITNATNIIYTFFLKYHYPQYIDALKLTVEILMDVNSRIRGDVNEV